MCILRDSSVDSAFATLETAISLRESYPKLIAIGLDSDEMEHPPSKFKEVFELAKSKGFRLVGHGGHDGPPSPYIWELLTSLHVERIDHGVRCVEDSKLVEEILRLKIPLTVCPVSNVKIGPFESLAKHPIKEMMDKGMIVSINSDDPAYLQCYISEVYMQVATTFNLSKDQVRQLSKNAVLSSFASPEEKSKLLQQIDSTI